MRIQEKRTSRKKKLAIISASLALVALLAGSILYVYVLNGNIFGWTSGKKSTVLDSNIVNNEKPTEEQKDAGTTIKENSVNTNQGDKLGTSTSDKVPTPSPNANGKSKVDVTITASNLSVNLSTYQIRSLISAVVSTGTCTLTLTQSDKVVTKTAGIQSLSSSSTCQGFDVPTSELAPGKWQVGLNFENNTLTGSASTSIVIQ